MHGRSRTRSGRVRDALCLSSPACVSALARQQRACLPCPTPTHRTSRTLRPGSQTQTQSRQALKRRRRPRASRSRPPVRPPRRKTRNAKQSGTPGTTNRGTGKQQRLAQRKKRRRRKRRCSRSAMATRLNTSRPPSRRVKTSGRHRPMYATCHYRSGDRTNRPVQISMSCYDRRPPSGHIVALICVLRSTVHHVPHRNHAQAPICQCSQRSRLPMRRLNVCLDRPGRSLLWGSFVDAGNMPEICFENTFHGWIAGMRPELACPLPFIPLTRRSCM